MGIYKTKSSNVLFEYRLIDCSNLPLSVAIVGVGGKWAKDPSMWETMNELYGDDGLVAKVRNGPTHLNLRIICLEFVSIILDEKLLTRDTHLGA